MSVRSVYTVMSLLLLSTLWSCRKEVSTENPSGFTPGVGSFTAQIDGVTWTAADSAKAASMLAGQINLIGVSSDNRQMSITLNDTVVGTYSLNQASVSLATFASNDSSGLYAFTSDQGSDTSQAGGTVTVTEIDKANQTISGTFAFKLYRDIDGHQKIVKNGFFNKVPYISSLPPASNGDTISATIDGAAWVGESIVAAAFSGQVTINGSNLNASQSVGLVMPLAITPGSYPLDYTGITHFGLYYPLPTIGLASSSGTLTIISNNAATHQIEGKFDFKAVNPQKPTDLTHQLTNGYFFVTYN